MIARNNQDGKEWSKELRSLFTELEKEMNDKDRTTAYELLQNVWFEQKCMVEGPNEDDNSITTGLDTACWKLERCLRGCKYLKDVLNPKKDRDDYGMT